VADEPSWDDIFRPAGEQATPPFPTSAPPREPVQPLTRRERRQAEADRRDREPRRRRRGWIGWLVALLVVLLAAGGAAWWAWTYHEDRVRELLGWELPSDYEGAGNGVEAVVVVRSGDIGEDVARTLVDAGVTMTFKGTYAYMLSHPDISYVPGSYRLQEHMSAASALTALQDPANRVTDRVTIPEGLSFEDALALIASATDIPLADLEAQAADYTQFGVPADAPSIEGFLFPATYTFDPGTTAHDAIQRLVDEMFSRLDAAGVAPEDRLRVLTLAGLVQREAGSDADMPKIARVFLNRIDQGMLLQSDATVAYGTGNTHTVWTTGAERNDPSNPYNTYVHPGLPVGPIGLPGEAAIDAALHPADGPWLFFVPVNLKTGETVFSTTAAEHDAAVKQLQAWCRASDENAAYCG